MHFRSIHRLAVATVVCASSAAAQSTGSIRGIVTSGVERSALQGARVSVESPARVAITDASGKYALRDLPSGRYDVTITALGYKPLRKTLDVTHGQSMSLDAALERGSLLLSGVVTTATRTAVDANRPAATINVLTPEQVRQSPARESQDLLREIPGVELPRTSSLVGGTAQIVSIRGVDEGRTAVTFDGIPVNDAWGEWIDWGRVPKSMLDRVEVVEGGTSSLYGNGAMGGIISFFSRPLAPGAVSLSVDGGSRNSRHISAAAGIPIFRALTANVSGDYQDGGGYRLIGPGTVHATVNGADAVVSTTSPGAIDQRSEIIQRNAYVRLNYAPSTRLSAFVGGHKYGDNRIAGTALNYQTRDQGEVSGGLDVGQAASGLLSLRAWDGRQDEHQRSTGVRGNSSTCAIPSTAARQCEDSSVVANIPSHDYGASAIWTRSNMPYIESVSIGGDYRHYNGNFDEVDFNTTCPGANCGKVSRTILSGGDQDLSGAFAQAILAPIAPIRVELSARVDRWNNANGTSIDATAGTTTYPDSSKTAFSPRVGVRYQVMSRFSVHGAYYQAFRAPNLAELYRKQISATSITLPNPYLKAEHALGREVGFDFQPFDWAQVKGTYYVADYKDFNVPVTLSTTAGVTTRQRLNVNKSRSKGGEAYIALRPIQQLFLSGSVNYDDARVVSGPTGTVVGAHINRVPSPKQTIRGTYTSKLLGSYTGIWRHEGHTTTLQGLWLDPYTVMDANAQREIMSGLSAFVSVENLTDKTYQINLSGAGTAALVSYGMPRTVRVGLTVARY